MSAGSLILDSESRGLLNENFLGGNVIYDNEEYEYSDNNLTYDGTPTLVASATGSLGSLVGGASSTVQVLASAESNLDKLNASSISNVTKLVSAASEFGELNSGVNSLVEKISEAAAALGELNAFAVPLTERFVSANSELGGLQATASVEVDNIVAASADLGLLTASAESLVQSQNSATADLGGMNAQAISQVIPPTPPEPPTPSIGNGRANYSIPRLKKKVKPQIVEPEIPVVKETKPSQPVFKTVTASADTLAGIFSAKAESNIDFSILEDEAELLLLI
jgi:hypothetical protein